MVNKTCICSELSTDKMDAWLTSKIWREKPLLCITEHYEYTTQLFNVFILPLSRLLRRVSLSIIVTEVGVIATTSMNLLMSNCQFRRCEHYTQTSNNRVQNYLHFDSNRWRGSCLSLVNQLVLLLVVWLKKKKNHNQLYYSYGAFNCALFLAGYDFLLWNKQATIKRKIYLLSFLF